MFEYAFPMAAVTATMIIFQKDEGKILIGRRDRNKSADAFPGFWCLPGGFLDVGTERLVNTARRETIEECGLDIDESRWNVFYIDDRPGADPRYTQVVNVCYFANATREEMDQVVAGDDLEDTKWATLNELRLTQFAFDHAKILDMFCDRIMNGTIA